MKKVPIVLLILLCMLTLGMTEELPRTTEATAFTKLGRGIGNMIKAPFEIPMSMTYIAKNTDAFLGAFLGFFTGAVAGLERGFVGAFETVTFPFPPYGEPLIEYRLGESEISEGVVSAFPPNF